MSIRAGGGGSKRRKAPLIPKRPESPRRPLENPFPEKPEFRLGHYRIVEERDDYVICEGFDPNSKNPFPEIQATAFRTIKVAKPPVLQRTIWDGQTVTIDGVDYTYDYSDTEFGVRTATFSGGEEEQRIDFPYRVNDLLVAVEIRKSAAVDGMEVTDEEGTRLRWMDLNVSGRHWKRPGGGDCACVTVHEIRFEGSVTGGSVILSVGIDPDGLGADVESVTLNYNDAKASVQTAYEGHTNIAAAGADITVKGGPLPDAAVYIVFLSSGNLNRDQPVPTVNTNSLTGTNVKIKTSYMTNHDWEA